jgi:hypothetical protein
LKGSPSGAQIVAQPPAFQLPTLLSSLTPSA